MLLPEYITVNVKYAHIKVISKELRLESITVSAIYSLSEFDFHSKK